MLRQDLFLSITQLWGTPDIDLFAFRLNAQLPCYVSRKPDPGASHTDAFTIPWTDYFFYAFPPFSIILHCVQKIEQEEAEGMLVVPNWLTQPWYTKLMQMITDYPRLLPVQKDILTHPSQKGSCHPLWQRLHVMACKLSGQLIQKQGVSTEAADIILKSWRPGTTSKQYHHISGNGYSIAIKGVLIQLIPLWDKH